MVKGGKDNKKGFGDLKEWSPRSELEEAMLNKCESLFNDGKFDETLSCCTQLEKRMPDIVMAYYYRGMVFYNLNKFEDAIKIFNEGIVRDPTFWLMHHSKGLCLFRMEKFDDALKCLMEALKCKPNEVTSLVLAGICLILKQDTTKAINYIKKGSEVNLSTTYTILNSFVDALLKSESISKESKDKLMAETDKLEKEIQRYENLNKALKESKKKRK